MVANSRGGSTYRGVTFGLRKRFSQGYQLEGNYVLAKDEDDDSNERDPFTDRSFNFFDLDLDWGPSDRDIRHKVNFFSYFIIPHGFWATRPGTWSPADLRTHAASTATTSAATARGRTTRTSRSTGGCRGPSGSASATR
jgi:hypothetical protein